MGWELLSEHVHFQPPGLFGFLLMIYSFPALEYNAPALSLAQRGESRQYFKKGNNL